MPFDGLPLFWQLLFTAAFAVIAFMLVWTTLLFFRGRARPHLAPDAPPDGADAFTWVFLVPALNEAVTIRDSVSRLLEMPVAPAPHRGDRRRLGRRHGGAARRAAGARPAHPAPRAADARLGKAAALNHAYRGLAETLGEPHRPQPGHRRASSTPTAAWAPTRRGSPPRSSPWTSTSAASRRWCGSTTATTGSPGCRTSSSASTATSTRPGARTGGPPGWAATGSSTGSPRSTRSPATRARGAIA